MKKNVCIVLVAILLVAGLFSLTGCGNSNNGGSSEYNKEVETQTIKTTDGTGTVTFEFEKADKYKVTTSGKTATIRNTENYAEIKVTALHDYMNSATITKEEKDFYSEKYHDYKKVTVGNYSGWEIYKGETEYDTVLVLTEKEANTNKVYAAEVQVVKSPIMKENMKFDTAEFVKGEDFQHLLNSIKVSVNQ